MIRCLILTGMLLWGTACKKGKENAQDTALENFITGGQWKVTKLIEEDSTFTVQFVPYLFKFNTNSTVDALKNGSLENTGTWEGSIINRTIISYFSNASQPLPLLNGTWQITSGGSSYVEAKKNENGRNSFLRLDKM